MATDLRHKLLTYCQTPSVDPPPPLLTDNLSTPLPEKQSNCAHQNSFQGGTQYAKLSEDGKAKVENILYLIDKFGVGMSSFMSCQW